MSGSRDVKSNISTGHFERDWCSKRRCFNRYLRSLGIDFVAFKTQKKRKGPCHSTKRVRDVVLC